MGTAANFARVETKPFPKGAVGLVYDLATESQKQAGSKT